MNDCLSVRPWLCSHIAVVVLVHSPNKQAPSLPLARKAVGLSLEIPEVRILRTRPAFMAISFVESFIRIALSRAYEAE